MTENARMEPLSYEFVTKEVCKKWSDSGKADLASKFVQARWVKIYFLVFLYEKLLAINYNEFYNEL